MINVLKFEHFALSVLTKMLVIRAGIQKKKHTGKTLIRLLLLLKICPVCQGFCGRQLMFKIL